MGYYINNISTSDNLHTDIKELIPDATMRRRMSRVGKMGVSTAMETLKKGTAAGDIDAVITATGLGCLADSEKFMRNMTDNDEELLNPTPFIQSTFNTVGAQIALLCGNHSYNMTYAHRGRSFECALIDSMMHLQDKQARNVLIGAFDESTPAQYRIMERMGLWRKGKNGEGAVFLILSDRPREGCVAQLEYVELLKENLSEDECRKQYAVPGNCKVIWNSYNECGCFHTASAYTFNEGVKAIAKGTETTVIYNSYFGQQPTIIVLKCI